jgi:hypothetical protein
MFVIPAIAVLFTFVYLRPHELFESMSRLNVNLVSVLVAFALVLDWRVGALKVRRSPLLVALVLLFVWSLITTAIKAPEHLGEQLVLLLISLIGFIGVSEGLQSLRAIGVAAAMLLGFTLFLAVVSVYQGTRSPVCYVLEGETTAMGPVDVPDGRPCGRRNECEENGLPERDYACEKPGILGTHSIGGRVRFRGLLEDPNELAWVMSMGTPLALALFERKRSATRLAALVATLVFAFWCVILTQSRSGQLSMIFMLGVYFVRRFGKRGAILGALVALPVYMLGGRSGEEADSSSEERLECWSEGMSMWRENPFTGVGGGQFLQHHTLTAHSAFVLTLAELGPIGLFLWTTVLYTSFKILIGMQIRYAGRVDAAAARTWGTALLAAQVGLLVSAFFLSIPYHAVLWIFLGLTGALYESVRNHEPGFEVRFSWRDLTIIAGLDIGFVVFVMLYLRLKGI